MATLASPSVKKAALRSRHPIIQKAGMPMYTSTHSAWPPLQHADQLAFTCYANTSSIRWASSTSRPSRLRVPSWLSPRFEDEKAELPATIRNSDSVFLLKKNTKKNTYYEI